MGSPEVISQIQELTTPPQGEGDISYGLVVHSNRGSYEPKWYTGINNFKSERTPNGVFEVKSSSAMYGVKKYCEAGDVQLLVVRPNTGALMSGLDIFSTDPTITFKSFGATGTKINIGDCITHSGASYICKSATTVPETIGSAFLTGNFYHVTPASEPETTTVAIDFDNRTCIKKGTKFVFTGSPNSATVSGAVSYPAYIAILPHSELVSGDRIFGWCNPSGTAWKFGYFIYDGTSFTLETEVSPVNNEYELSKDIINGNSTAWVSSDSNLSINYAPYSSIKEKLNVESYANLKANTSIFGNLPSVGSIVSVGNAFWYADAPYICIKEAVVPSEVTLSWVNYYLTSVGIVNSSNYIGWSEGVNLESEIEQPSEAVMTVYTSNGGEWGNNISFTLTNYVDDPDDIEVEGAFRMEFFERGISIGSFIVTRKQGILDANGNSMYVEDVINKRMVDVRVKDNLLIPEEVLPITQLSPVYLKGGANGLYPNDADMIKALEKIQDEAKYPLFAVGDGGYSTKAFAKALASFVNQRKGTKAVITVPQTACVSGDPISDINEYIVDLNISDDKVRIETYWGTEFDADTGRDVMIPPDCLYIRNEALTKRSEGLYVPNAGWEHGAIDVDLVNKWDKGQRDLLDKIRCNYAKYDRNMGSCIFSEQTTLARPSYRQQDHIVKVLLDIIPKHEKALEKYIEKLAEDGIFNKINYDLNESMKLVQSGHGCDWFEVTCSRVNNSQATLDAQEVNVWVEFRPINAIKTIKVLYGLTNGGVRLADIQG